MSEPVAVRVRDCECPGTPHADEGDVVYVAPTPSLDCALDAQADILETQGDGQLLRRRWTRTFVRHGAIGWNFLTEGGRPVPFDLDVLLADYTLSADVAERCDELYGDAVLRPLLARLQATLLPGQTNGSTPHTAQSTRKRRGPSSRVSSVGSRR